MVVNWVDKVGVKVEVGKFVLKLLVPVQVLLFAWIPAFVVKFWEFKVVKLTSWFAVVADIVCVGKEVLKVFVPVQALLKDGLTNDCPFKVKKLRFRYWLLLWWCLLVVEH